MPLVPGLYDLPLTEDLRRRIEGEARRFLAATEGLDSGDSHEILARHLADVVRSVLLTIPEEERLAHQLEIVNQLLAALGIVAEASVAGSELVAPAQRLTAIYEPSAFREGPPAQPAISVSQSDLLVNATGEPRVVNVLQSEVESADRIDLLIAFIRWSGLRLIEPKLREFLDSGRPMRVITTTYTGSTERRAIERLVEMGAHVKVSYQTDNTRLHAKAWLFHRETGFSTAYIGSSNLSNAALVDGLEWNVRLAEADAPAIVEKFRATFETYWADPDFELYERDEEHRTRFDRAVAASREGPESQLVFFDIHPYPHQSEILDRLHVERYRHGRWKNLVVAATGTGKTVVAALDYRRLGEEGIFATAGLAESHAPHPAFGHLLPPGKGSEVHVSRETEGAGPPHEARPRRRLRLLFVAHRREILQQSLNTFRTVMHDGSFGEPYVDGARPAQGDHVFASVQSLANVDVDEIPPDYFDVVIIDEFHHAAAPTYRRILEHLKPRVLLGLTATPERTDGQSVLEWFDGRYAVELRLWDALDRGLLSPFHYFGLHDDVDLSAARWVRGKYDAGEVENLYTGNDARLTLILSALRDKISDISRMRALGFCVGVSHAEYMARRFNEAGIPAAAVVGETSNTDRDAAIRRLTSGEINALFAVDIFNEGVDVPQIDTVLFLRPTESATVFLQQLGRGLRRTRDKAVLTVLDFIGNANRNFRFDLRYRALAGGSRRQIEEQVEQGFPLLPAGCAIQLDRETSRIVLENLRQTIGNRFASLVAELRALGPSTSLAAFLDEARLELEDLYRTRGWSWTRLRRDAFGLLPRPGRADGAGDPSPRFAAPPPTAHAASPAQDQDGTHADRVADAEVRNSHDDELRLTAIPRLLHLDDQRRISFLREIFGRDEPPDLPTLAPNEQRIIEGLLITLFGREERDPSVALARLWSAQSFTDEFRQILGILEDRAEHETPPMSDVMGSRWANIPLSLHARYSLDEVTAAIGRSTLAKPVRLQGGVLWDEATNADWFFITLEKSEKHYSPTTRYRDYAISPEEFHWESQGITRQASETGQRYIDHARRGSNVFLFVRQTRRLDGNRTAPYTFLGPGDYVRHSGERPMAIVWRLRRAMPLDLFKKARVAAG